MTATNSSTSTETMSKRNLKLYMWRLKQLMKSISINDSRVVFEMNIHINVYWTILIIRNLALGLFQASVRHCQQHIKRRQSIVFFRGL